jgi:hypothetical protein
MQAFLAGMSVGASHSSASSRVVTLVLALLSMCCIASGALMADSLMSTYVPPPT